MLIIDTFPLLSYVLAFQLVLFIKIYFLKSKYFILPTDLLFKAALDTYNNALRHQQCAEPVACGESNFSEYYKGVPLHMRRSSPQREVEDYFACDIEAERREYGVALRLRRRLEHSGSLE